MNRTEASATELAVAGEPRATIARASPAIVMRCLLVSANEQHVDVITATAADEGWLAATYRAVEQVVRDAIRTQFHLAFVDIESVAGGPLQTEYELLASDLAQHHVPLIVISGNPDDPLVEIRARQLGVWLYLPGFDGKTELDVVFREARAVHEKLQGVGQEISVAR